MRGSLLVLLGLNAPCFVYSPSFHFLAKIVLGIASQGDEDKTTFLTTGLSKECDQWSP